MVHGEEGSPPASLRNLLNLGCTDSPVYAGTHRAAFWVMNLNASPAIMGLSPARQRALRWVRSLLWIFFGVVIAVLVALACASSFVAGGFATGVVTALAAGVLVVGLRQLRNHPWTRLAAGYGVLTCALLYLANDDASVRPPPGAQPVEASFAGAQESYVALMRYGKRQPLGRDFRFQPSAQLQQGQAKWKPSDAGWAAWLTTNRAELERGWEKLEPLRNWWAEANAFDRIGDLTPSEPSADLIAFLPFRTHYQHACAIASLQALDGNEAAAIDTLLPILELSRKLQPTSRTLVRSMLAVAAQKMAIETATFMVDSTTLSSAGRVRLASALAANMAAEHAALRLVSMEYEWAATVINNQEVPPFLFFTEVPRWMGRCLRPFSHLVVNRRRTLNRYAELTLELQKIAVSREVGDIDAKAAKFLAAPGVHLKNFGGTVLLGMLTPSYKRVLETHWKTEDLRTALQARLQA